MARVVLRGTSLLEADQPEQQEEFETAESLRLETIITVFVNPVVVQLSWFENSASRFRSVHVEAEPGYKSRRPGLHEVSTIALTGRRVHHLSSPACHAQTAGITFQLSPLRAVEGVSGLTCMLGDVWWFIFHLLHLSG